MSTTDRAPDCTEIDEQTGRRDEGRHTGVDRKVSIWDPVKKPSGHCVDNYCQHNADIRDMQLPRLMRSVDKWAVNTHEPPKEDDCQTASGSRLLRRTYSHPERRETCATRTGDRSE